jgi:hypothetical protein
VKEVRNRAIELVNRERERQIELHGDNNLNNNELMWLTILTQEVGEVANSIKDIIWKGSREALGKDKPSPYLEECVHVCAVALAMIECELSKETE